MIFIQSAQFKVGTLCHTEKTVSYVLLTLAWPTVPPPIKNAPRFQEFLSKYPDTARSW
jgi:hypothetical protein